MENVSKMNQIEYQVKNLKSGEVMIVSAREVNGDKYSIEFAQNVLLEGASLTALLNKSDERFKSSSVLRAWKAVELEDFSELFNINLPEEVETIERQDGKMIDVYPLGVLNPLAAGHPVSLQINEGLGIDPKSEWENDNTERAIKKNPNEKTGGYLYFQGQPIVRRMEVISGTNPSHTILTHDEIRESIVENFEVAEEVEA